MGASGGRLKTCRYGMSALTSRSARVGPSMCSPAGDRSYRPASVGRRVEQKGRSRELETVFQPRYCAVHDVAVSLFEHRHRRDRKLDPFADVSSRRMQRNLGAG
jgi:hypothetical protein